MRLHKQNREFKDVRWLAGALNKKSGRLYTTYIKKTGHYMVACDGSRLHYLEMGEYFTMPKALQDGFYRVIKNTKSEIEIILDPEAADMTYPDISSIVDPMNDTGTIENTEEQFTDEGTCFGIVAKLNKSMDENTAVNYNFVEDMFCNDDGFKIWQEESGKPINFKNGNKFGVIMPCRV